LSRKDSRPLFVIHGWKQRTRFANTWEYKEGSTLDIKILKAKGKMKQRYPSPVELAAKEAGVSPSYVYACIRIAKSNPEMIPLLTEGKLTIPQALAKIKEKEGLPTRKPRNWESFFVEAARETLDEFYLNFIAEKALDKIKEYYPGKSVKGRNVLNECSRLTNICPTKSQGKKE